jgi:hypothetical protein
VFGEGDSLLRVGVAMMALALALVIAAIVVSVALRSEPGRVVAAEVAAKSPREEPQRCSSEEDPPQQSGSSYGAVEQREGKVEEPDCCGGQAGSRAISSRTSYYAQGEPQIRSAAGSGA